MPRNVSGLYTLPLPPVVPGTVIEAAFENTTDEDIAQSLTDSLDRYGRGGMLAPMRVSDGTAALPSFSFNSDTSAGMWLDNAGGLAFSTDGVQRGVFSAVPNFTLGTDPGNGTVGFYNRFRLESTATSQYGIFENTMLGDCDFGYGVYAKSRFAAGSYTTDLYSSLRVDSPTLGLGQTLLEERGVDIPDLTGGSSSTVGVYLGMTDGADRYGLRSAGTVKSWHRGNVQVGGTVASTGNDSPLVVVLDESSGTAVPGTVGTVTLVLDSDSPDSNGLVMLGDTDAFQSILFVDPAGLAGLIGFDHTDDTMQFYAGTASVDPSLVVAATAVLFYADPQIAAASNAPLSTLSMGFRGVPIVNKSVAYTTGMSDAGKCITHPAADTTARIWTVPTNASVAYPLGTTLSFANLPSAGVITLTSADTLLLNGVGTPGGSKTLATGGFATATKVATTTWMLTGTGIT